MSKDQDKPSGAPISRRAALASAAAFAGAMMWNADAFGWEYCDDPTNQANVKGWSGTEKSHDFGSDGGTIIGDYSRMAYGLKCQTYTKWMHWNMGHGVGWLGIQMDLVATTDFETELFYHNSYLPLTAGFSNSVRSQGWQQTNADDSAYTLRAMWKPGEDWFPAASGSFDMDTTESSPYHVYQSSWLDEDHYDYWTDLQNWGGTTWDIFPRRGPTADRELWVCMCGSWWLFYHFGSYNCTVSGQTRWLTQYVPKVRITLTPEGCPTCGLEWAGRILNVRSYTDNGKCLFVGNSVKVADSGTTTGLWAGPEWTNRQWACVLNGNGTADPASWGNTNRWTGTVSFANVMQVAEGTEAVWLDQAGGGPSTAKNIAAQICTGNGSAAQAFWVHTDGAHQMIFSDASGHALARDYNKDDDGTTVLFWSDGDGKDLEDTGCWWVLDDARFSLRPGLELNTISTSPDGTVRDEGICVGDTVSFPDLAPLTYPKIGYGETSNLGYDYMWVAIDEADDGKWLDDQVEVWARAHVGGMGTLPVEQPTINVVGAYGLHALEAVHLRVKGSSLSGGIEYRYRNRSTGIWQDWVSGSADDDGTGSDSWAGEKGTSYRADGFSARLTGELAERYTLFYKVGSGASGWSAWCKDGEDCIDPKSHFDAICVRIVPKWVNDDEYGFGASQNEMKITDDMLGKKIIPVCRAFIKQSSIGLLYLGTVAGSADVTSVWYDKVEVLFIVDGEAYVPIPGDKIQFDEGDPIVIDPSWTEGAKKFGNRDETCSGFDGWYSDPECTTPWVDGYVPKKGTKSIKIYARNKVVIDFKPSTHALAMMGGLALANGEGNPASIADVPPVWSGWYGDKVTIPAPADTTLYAMDAGKKRTYTCTAGVYARDWDGSGTAPQLIPFGTHPVTSSGTRYYDWLDSPYDGFIGR